MADAARRSLYKVTYAPIRPSNDDERAGLTARRNRGLEKIAFANALRATPRELEVARASVGNEDPPGTDAALRAIEGIVSGGGRASKRAVARTPHAALIGAGRALARHRRQQRNELREHARKLAQDHAAFVRTTLETVAAPLSREVPPRVGASPVLPNAGSARAGSTARGRPTAGASHPPVESDPRLNAASLKPTFAEALDWARVRDPGRADHLARLARDVAGIRPDIADVSPVNWDVVTDAVATADGGAPEWTDAITEGFAERMHVEPIGRLHLERIDMTPVAVTRGELLHSVGLAPKETITLIHREWSSRVTTFEKAITEEFEQSKEDSVTENAELATATEVQSRHSSAFSMEATASGSYGFASGSVTIGYNTTSEDESAKKISRNDSVEVTSKAASRTRKEHKVTFTVKEEAGVEDQSVRTLANPSDTEPMRIDFHQLLRKWKVDLYRYGLRLTYDLVLPAPGIELLAKVAEIQRINHMLGQPLQFTLSPKDITREEWPTLASQYSAEIEPPEPETLTLYQTFTYEVQAPDDLDHLDTIQFDIPAGYYVNHAELHAYILFHLNQNANFDVINDLEGEMQQSQQGLHYYNSGLEGFSGHVGRINVVLRSFNVQSGHVQATLYLAQTNDAWEAWQSRAWIALRAGAEELRRTLFAELRERRSQLDEELARWDPLTLRRMEREEVMKTTIQWILGPDFDLMSGELAQIYDAEPGGLATVDPSGLTREQWAHVLERGEFIKFLHQAIEWENVLYFIYPYFWDQPRNHELKRFLEHPDSIHRAFLRGGAARVVLTVRPGFETSFTQLIENGFLDEALEQGHPYLTIANEIRAYSETNYPGIPASDGGSDPTEAEIEDGLRGKRVARWYEHTPVSALDITVNTPLTDLS